jgi:pimeloyl-ACP methyl ester carboxylesterase
MKLLLVTGLLLGAGAAATPAAAPMAPITAPTVASAAAPTAAPAAAVLDWHACGDLRDAECATLTVPVDWSDPDGPKLGLAVARRQATDPAHRIGTLVFGPGGPWDSGVDRVANHPGRFSTLAGRFDIVSFDPRGSNGSDPVSCDPGLVAAAPAPVLGSKADFDARLAYNRRLWADCRQRTGPLWDHADTLSSVRDLEALRAALGERQITYHGSSYGTLLGQEYAERYPGRVRAMLLESVVDHSSRSTAEFLTAQSWALQDAFGAFVSWCDLDVSCALHGRDVRQVWRDVLANVDKSEISAFDLVAAVHQMTKNVAYAKLATYLAALDSGSAGQKATGLNVVIPAFCADWSIPVRNYQEYTEIMSKSARVAPDVRFSAQSLALTLCLGWPHPANPQHATHVRTATPLLLINSRHDPATGLNWARGVEKQLGRKGVLVTYEGAGHGSYTLSDCIRRTADDYLTALKVPARGTTCPA